MAQQLPEHDIDTGECDLTALGEDIEDLIEYISPVQRQLVVEALVRRLQHIVDDIWNTPDKLAIIQHPVKLQLYGSSSTGLDLPTRCVLNSFQC
jgi:DNA polymerase sigma